MVSEGKSHATGLGGTFNNAGKLRIISGSKKPGIKSLTWLSKRTSKRKLTRNY
jgi:hypothetical protein